MVASLVHGTEVHGVTVHGVITAFRTQSGRMIVQDEESDNGLRGEVDYHIHWDDGTFGWHSRTEFVRLKTYVIMINCLIQSKLHNNSETLDIVYASSRFESNFGEHVIIKWSN